MRILVMIIFFTLSIVYAYGEEHVIWIPEKMIIGEEYEGVVIARNATEHTRTVILIGDERLDIPERVTINPHQNHARFKVTPLSVGNSTVFSILDENFATKSTIIYKNNELSHSLKIVLQKRIVDQAIGYIFLLDSNGVPTEAEKDIRIRLVAEGGVSLIDNVTIKRGSYYTSFIARVESDGMIHAISDDARSSSIEVRKDREVINLKLGIAPHLVLPDSKAYFYLWLEKDGKPYVPPKPLNAILTSSNINVASFNPIFKDINDNKHSIVIDESFEWGEIFTHDIGNATITAFINGVGATSTNLIVGALISKSLTITNQEGGIGETFSSQNFTITKIPRDVTATDVFLWVYPTIIESNGKAEGLVALYQIKKNVTQEVILGKNNTVTLRISSAESIIPVANDSTNFRIIDLSSNGLNHPSVLKPSFEFKEYAIRFGVEAIQDGRYTIIAGGSNLSPSSIEVDVIPKVNHHTLDASILPIKKGVKQPLMILPGTGYTIVTDEDIDLEIYESYDTIVYGIIEKDTTFIISKDTIHTIVLSPNSSMLRLELDAPDLAHKGEDFPIAIHLVDNGIPLTRIDHKHLIIGDDRILVITDDGILEKGIDLFLNRLRFNVTVNGEDVKSNHTINANVGERSVIEIDTDGFISIDSEIDYEMDENRIIITPNEHGEYDLSIKAYREGYMDESIDIKVMVKRFVSLAIIAESPRGDLNLSLESTIGRLETPYRERLEVREINITFPQKHNDLDLQRIVIDSANDTSSIRNSIGFYLHDDTIIRAIYGRNIIINVEDGEGSGSYPIGSSVTISAKDKPIIPVILTEVFDHWEGLPDGYDKSQRNLTFIADENMNIRAIYRIDYLGLLLPITVAVAVIITRLIRR